MTSSARAKIAGEIVRLTPMCRKTAPRPARSCKGSATGPDRRLALGEETTLRGAASLGSEPSRPPS